MKYIDAEKLIAEIDKRLSIFEHGIAYDCWASCKKVVESIQQEQPMPDSTKLIELWHQDKEMLKEKDFRNEPWILAYNAFMCGFGRGLAVKQQGQPVHSHYTKVRETKTGKLFLAEYSIEAAEWYEAGTGNAYSISDVEIIKDQPEVDLDAEIAIYLNRNLLNRINNSDIIEDFTTMEAGELAEHFYELGLNARKEECK